MRAIRAHQSASVGLSCHESVKMEDGAALPLDHHRQAKKLALRIALFLTFIQF